MTPFDLIFLFCAIKIIILFHKNFIFFFFFIKNIFHNKARQILQILRLKNWLSLLLRFGFDFY